MSQWQFSLRQWFLAILFGVATIWGFVRAATVPLEPGLSVEFSAFVGFLGIFGLMGVIRGRQLFMTLAVGSLVAAPLAVLMFVIRSSLER